MKKMFSKTIFFIVLCILFYPVGQVGALQECYARVEKVLEFVCEDYKIVKSESELGYKENKYNLSSADLAIKVYNMGFSFKDILGYVYPNLDKVLSDICASVDIMPLDSTIMVESGYPIITNEVEGRRVDTSRFYRDLFIKLIGSSEINIKVEVKTITLAPVRTREKNSFLTNEKSSFITYINGVNQEGRINNIARALSMFNGMCLMPGEVVSFNEVIGETSAENGYQLAKVILNGKYADDYGGGVCQAATTLYNAALIAGLEIVEANPHSLKVGYVKGSFDAMVSSGVSDLKIKNPYDEPIYIHTYATNEECGAKIFGMENEFEIKRRSEKIEFDEELLPRVQSKSAGYLDYYKDGELIKSVNIRKDNYYKLKVENESVESGANMPALLFNLIKSCQ